ncbi:MAG: ribosomal RNA small subunit methyltransferase A [Parcubacteria group bacterium RIFCSPLOWO2_01_FULL_40_65]|nr:MAG: ribosomal RNA small subunit methyltransferase A [Parcubacteria group bacterium RIFCSPHIGHO2_01_FULL_40_30]OHB19601.1 MAG: ribosomal RNA small subunit methyltransferase A [Parcubacteria group bacterium RIFCSPHIGHO2_02_FULL_40_12]OHB21950.1 MAG: ribosomal RNA small subunit methyltransferase A [Parcubacteria group bacterium RIFCSPLOWO2_01_FULL_40_65]OHB24334.1 MAG: ribosomal RNA small subunit methyltransferase A [Parcubacteria group bacterium RIFCSPLOWO2_12_FULL_40_10]
MKLSVIPKKSLGQHFLINPRILDKIVAAAEISNNDTVLEIGPGTGNLTEKLSIKAGKVIAIEKDRRLIESLKEKFKNKNVEIVESDVLKLKIETLIENYKIVANIPYYITSNLLRIILEKWPKPKLIVLTIQKEVAQRIISKSPRMNLLALSVQFFAEPKIVGYISKENFRPRPKVDSAIIKLMPKEKLPSENPEKLFKITRAGFSGKRKQLINSLSINLKKEKIEIEKALKKAEINLKSRPEQLELKAWITLEKLLN